MNRTQKADEKVMFEIYRDEGYDRRYRIVYFTELGEHDREREINRAVSGSHVFDGFLDARRMADAKPAIAALLDCLNGGDAAAAEGIGTELSPFLVA